MINWTHLESNLPQFRENFDQARPFRWVLIDDFLTPSMCKSIGDGFEVALAHKDHGATKSHKNVLRKTGTPNLKLMTQDQVGFFEAINSTRFTDWLSKLTGIANIYGDPQLNGGGLHSSVKGGFLNIHTDFNFHPITFTHRRLNLIFYVNEEWREEWEGGLELWNADITACEAKVFPKFNRAVLFETSEISFHGHPIPLACPDDIARKSLAVYYYSDWPDGIEQRAKTNYVLAPWQRQELFGLIADSIRKGAKTFEEAAEMIPAYQPAFIKRMFSEVMNATRR